MCGIVGYWSQNKTDQALIRRMTDRLRHRGPDDSGVWLDSKTGLALGHRRLAIIDLSTAGKQPMISACSRFVIAYNGEVYNYRELKKELAGLGHGFQGDSDTEVILAAIVQWGLAGALAHFVGMFAFVLWDNKKQRLALVRDRLGIKPLYYGWVGQAFTFASELSPFTVFPGFDLRVDRQALGFYLRHNCVPAPLSIYERVHKLMPGHILWVWENGERTETEQYWSAVEAAQKGRAEPFPGNADEAEEELHGLLSRAVGCRMIADVPLGAFLSGGVDSSTVVALMQAQSSRPVKTFSIGNTDARFDEAVDAALVAHHLGTDHTELYVSPEQAMEIIPKLPGMFDEPFADSSQIPTFLVCEMARQQVSVVLSGDGGDELFAGYNRHVWAPGIWQKMRPWPVAARQLLSSLLCKLSPGQWDVLFARLAHIAPKIFGVRMPGYKIQKLAETLRAVSFEDMYTILTSHWQAPCNIMQGLGEETQRKRFLDLWELPDLLDFIMLVDLTTYLPDDILTKVDRASMSVSLEARVPIIDHRVAEFAWRLPRRLKLRNGQSKWILRQVLYKYVPKELIERPKSGFGVPIEHWLRGPLRDWAEALLDERRLHQEGFFKPAPIRRAWQEHISGKRNRAYPLWDILMFQAWLEKFGRRNA